MSNEENEVKSVEFTKEQAEIHVIALHANLKRLKRSLNNAEHKLNIAKRNGDEKAERHFQETHDYLQKLVDGVTEELEVMRDLFGSQHGLNDD